MLLIVLHENTTRRAFKFKDRSVHQLLLPHADSSMYHSCSSSSSSGREQRQTHCFDLQPPCK